MNIPPEAISASQGLASVVPAPPPQETPDVDKTNHGDDRDLQETPDVATTNHGNDRDLIFANPGLFIALIIIGSISVVVITVGFIYLVCDRRRSTRGEYITNINKDLDLGIDNPAMLQHDKALSNGNGNPHLVSITMIEDEQCIVPYDSFTQEEIMNCEVEDTHL